MTSIKILNPECDIYDDAFTIANVYDENYEPYFNGTIYCYENSTAQAYSEKYGYKFEVIGDVNGDEEFNIADVVLLQKYLLGDSDAVLSDWQNADLCADGRLDVFDFCMMKKKFMEDFI